MQLVNVPSNRKNEIYQVDTKKWTCTCKAFKFNTVSKTCKHIKTLKATYEAEGQQGENDAPTKDDMPYAVSKAQQEQIKDFDRYSRTRVSEHFLLRDFFYSARAEILGLPNRPSDDPAMVLRAGKMLCEKVCEPVLKKFGPFAITYGYQSRQLIEAGYKKVSKTSSAPHQWDRGTFGDEVYARIDILPYCVEDGKFTKYEVARWMMANLDIDLLMLWHHSNVMCVTISPKPRRVHLEWVKYGQGDGGSNCVSLMGEYYWQKVWPGLTEEQRPKYGPSATGGSMKW